MTPERWQQVKEAFEAALEQDPHQWAAFIERTCADDQELRHEVESLLASHEKARRFFENSAVDEAVRALTEPEIEMAGGRIGAYEIIREIGKGGMGAVYLASRADEAFEKRVAIKVVKRGMDTDEVLRRFRTERQILARLEYPHIARLLDGGTTEEGHPYVVMEYIEGQPITGYSNAHQLSVVERLKLFRLVCSAVQYAHQNLVVHRDIKPTNILVTADGEPKLLDFGIGKLLDPALDGQALPTTVTGLRMMTPEYASPEQVRCEPISTASDIYSLGVVLYELLTGHRPYRITSRQPYEIMHVVCEQEPERPSLSVAPGLSSVAADEEQWTTDEGRRTAKKLRQQLEGDLDNIVQMAMRKEPERRYASVEQFSEDIRRHLEGLPVIAQKDTLGYRAGKFIRRHKAGVAAAALVALSLIGGMMATAWQAKIAAEQRDRARHEAAKAQRVNTFLRNMFSIANPSWYHPGAGRSREVTLIEAFDEAARRVQTELADDPEAMAALRHEIGYAYALRGRYASAEPHLRAALETYRKLYGEKHSETVQGMRDLAALFLLKGDYAEAEPLYGRAVAIYRQQRAEGTVNLLGMVGTLSDFGALLRSRGEATRAEPLLREALELSGNVVGNQRAVVGIVLANLAVAREYQGDLEDAQALYRQSIDVLRSLSGGERMELGTILIGLAQILMIKGQYAEAEPLIREGLDLLRRLVGETHPYYASGLIQFGELWYLKGDYGRAEPAIRKALEIQRQTFPAGHVNVAASLTTLGLILTKTGRAAQGESYIREAWQIRRRIMVKGHWLIADTKSPLGECLTVQKRYAEAAPLLIESYSEIKAGQGEQHPRTVKALQRLVTLYEKWGKPDQAAKYHALLTQSRNK